MSYNKLYPKPPKLVISLILYMLWYMGKFNSMNWNRHNAILIVNLRAINSCGDDSSEQNWSYHLDANTSIFTMANRFSVASALLPLARADLHCPRFMSTQTVLFAHIQYTIAIQNTRSSLDHNNIRHQSSIKREVFFSFASHQAMLVHLCQQHCDRWKRGREKIRRKTRILLNWIQFLPPPAHQFVICIRYE